MPYDQALLADDTLIHRNPSVLAAEVDDEVVLMNVAKGRYFGLDDIGGMIWRRLDPPLTVGALVDGLAADYDAGRETIAADVRALLAEMIDGGLVEAG